MGVLCAEKRAEYFLNIIAVDSTSSKKRWTYFLECHHGNVICPSMEIFNIFKILRDNSSVEYIFQHTYSNVSRIRLGAKVCHRFLQVTTTEGDNCYRVIRTISISSARRDGIRNWNALGKWHLSIHSSASRIHINILRSPLSLSLAIKFNFVHRWEYFSLYRSMGF